MDPFHRLMWAWVGMVEEGECVLLKKCQVWWQSLVDFLNLVMLKYWNWKVITLTVLLSLEAFGPVSWQPPMPPVSIRQSPWWTNDVIISLYVMICNIFSQCISGNLIFVWSISDVIFYIPKCHAWIKSNLWYFPFVFSQMAPWHVAVHLVRHHPPRRQMIEIRPKSLLHISPIA